MLNSSLKNCFI